jgi:hypothetical protein
LDFEYDASFCIAGLLVATVKWQDMQVVVAGKVIRVPGAGFVWQVVQGSPNAKCVLWL